MEISSLLLIESLPQELSKKKVLCIGCDTPTLQAVQQAAPQHFIASHLRYDFFEASSTLATENRFEDFAQTAPKEHFDLILFPITKATIHNLKILSLAQKSLTPEGRIFCAGTNDSGIQGMASKLKKQGIICDVVINKRGGRVLSFQGTPELEATDYTPANTTYQFRHHEIGVSTLPGLFSYNKVDKGTQLLLKHLPGVTGKRILDLGCGSGIVSIAAHLAGAKEIIAADISATSVAISKENCANYPFISVVGSDMTEQVEGYFDHIFTNPPFHDGLSTDLTTGERWLDSILPHLHKGGVVWLVANAFISYGTMGRARFSEVERLEEKDGFIVYRMVK